MQDLTRCTRGLSAENLRLPPQRKDLCPVPAVSDDPSLTEQHAERRRRRPTVTFLGLHAGLMRGASRSEHRPGSGLAADGSQSRCGRPRRPDKHLPKASMPPQIWGVFFSDGSPAGGNVEGEEEAHHQTEARGAAHHLPRESSLARHSWHAGTEACCW